MSNPKEEISRNRIMKITRYFLTHSDATIEQAAEATGISRSEIKEEMRRARMLKAARYFITHSDSSIEQVSEATGIPRATVHRYLNHESLKLEEEELSDVCQGNPYDIIQSLLRKLDEKERRENILKVTKYILEHMNATILEISEATGISASSVQRYLSDDVIDELKDLDVSNPHQIIQGILKNHKQEGLSKGGQVATSNNEPIRDEKGHFVGATKKGK